MATASRVDAEERARRLRGRFGRFAGGGEDGLARRAGAGRLVAGVTAGCGAAATGSSGGSCAGTALSRGHSTTAPTARPAASSPATRFHRTRRRRWVERIPGPRRTAGRLAPVARVCDRMAHASLIYDLNLLLDSSLDEDRREKILADVETMIVKQGELLGVHDWGVRPTAYEVRKHADASSTSSSSTPPPISWRRWTIP